MKEFFEAEKWDLLKLAMLCMAVIITALIKNRKKRRKLK